MAETKGTRFTQVKTEDRHGTQLFGQASDGTGAVNDIPKFTADGSLTDSGIPISSGGGPGTAIGTWVDDEIPVPAPDNVTTTFSIANTPLAGTVSVFVNGVREDKDRWVTYAGASFTFAVAPLDIDKITVNYSY